MDALGAFGFHPYGGPRSNFGSPGYKLEPLIRSDAGTVYINVERGTLLVVADDASTCQEIWLGAGVKFVAPKCAVWCNIHFIRDMTKLVVRDAYLVKLPHISLLTRVVKCIGCSLEVVKHTKYIRRLNVLGNPVSSIKFSPDMQWIKISKQADVCILTPTCPVMTLQFICLHALMPANSLPAHIGATVRAMNIKTTWRKCMFCHCRQPCEIFYTHGVIKCVACYNCRLRRILPTYDVHSASDHCVLTPTNMHVMLQAQIEHRSRTNITSLTARVTHASRACDIETRITEWLRAACPKYIIRRMMFRGIELKTTGRLCAIGVCNGSTIHIDIIKDMMPWENI